MNQVDPRAGRSRARWIVSLVAVALAAGGYWYWQSRSRDAAAVEYRTTPVVRGPIAASVTATGTLNPVNSVQVGSQVSGQLKEVLVDYNSEVKEGQLIARIDPETFEHRVRQAEADLEASRAQVLTATANVTAARAALSRAEVNFAEARRDLDRKQQLVDRSFISPAELDKARATFNATAEDVKAARAQLEVAQAQTHSAEATVRQREAQLAQTRVDLKRTSIRSPVDGIVIKRSVDAGQTVAASLQAPELFVIARSLRDMEVDTSVDEAEIGRIRLGQRATFTVDAFPGRSFSGEVLQVRKAPQTVQNVVTYTVVVSARNNDLALIPGMTANVRIVTDTRESVLKVPNAALRFKPPGFQEPAPGRSATGLSAAALAAAAQALLPAAHAQSSSGPLAQLRERLERELALTEAQKQQLDAILAGMRPKFAEARSAPESERAKVTERNRAELRERISEILTPEQRARYAELVAQNAGRAPSRGRVFVLDPSGEPRPVSVRTGITDGGYTEIAGGELAEGDPVIVGIATPSSGAERPTSMPRPRLPF